ncbi:HHR102Cp [Eremothecium sinecaudum]|uniref:HHR102Cp n=1 Tax=Eremothecium sinecaudum TaxID=45286 RepID=A0A0X8HW93_9SACH|nr:HHR102Cp [Eremothecium sinecaudum]AMD22871.1 HHR102Cp [Eremothecium sinecaudum]
MGIFEVFGLGRKINTLPNDVKAAIESNIEICERDCGSCTDPELEKDQAVFDKFKLDRETSLFGSSKVPSANFIVPTSRMDWVHDACSEKKGSVQDCISKWVARHNDGKESSMQCNVSSLPLDIMDVEVLRGKKNTVLVLPHFIKLVGITSDNVDSILDEIAPMLIEGDVDSLLKKDYIEDCNESSFVFLCSHTTRDKRCGKSAPILRKHFNTNLQHHHLYREDSDFRRGGCRVAYINHVGGHKFAANVLIYLRKSRTLVWLGRVTPLHVKSIVDDLIVPEVPRLPNPENVRCVKKYDF